MPKLSSLTLLLAVAALATACGEAVERYRLVDMPSGRQVKLIEVKDVLLDEGDVGMLVVYELETATDELDRLRFEAARNFEEFRLEAEALGRRSVVLRGVHPDGPGWERDLGSIDFRIDRGADDRWTFRRDEVGAKG